MAERNVRREDYDWMVQNRDEWKQDRDNWKQRAEGFERASKVDANTVQRMTDEVYRLNEAAEKLLEECNRIARERDAARAEAEGLRADLLAHPPQRLDIQQYANLKDDYDLQATMIETLQDALKRTETRLAKAQGQHIDDRLKGFLAVISQLADQAQDLLP